MTATLTASVSTSPAYLPRMSCGRLIGFDEQRVDAAPLDFLGHEADADEDGDEEPEDGDRRQPEVLDDLHVLAGRQLTEEERRAR